MVGVLIDIGIFSNLFYTGFVFFKQPFEFYFSYIPLLILLPIFIIKYKFYAPCLYILIPLLVIGVFNVFIENNVASKFIKIYANLAVSLVFYQYVMQYYNYNVKLIFEKYLNISFFVCLIGLFQLFSYWIGFTPGYNLPSILPLNKWGLSEGGLGVRINSLFSEPSSLGIAIAPAFFVSVFQLIRRTNTYLPLKRCILIVICYCLSFSSLAFLGIFLTVVFLTLNFGAIRYFLFAIPISVFLFFVAYNNAKEFKVRVDGVRELFIENILDERRAGETNKAKRKRIQNFLTRVHGSSFVFYNNYYIAKQNFLKNPLFGTGLGSHEFAYDKYTLNNLIGGIYEFNTGDANSLFLRTTSEVGLFGAIFLILFVFKYYVSYNLSGGEEDDYWIVSNGLLILILLTYLRQGNYTYNGFLFYCWMYYYNSVNYHKYTRGEIIE